MIQLEYLVALGAGLVAVALAGIGTNRHFIIIMLGVELILLASTIVLIGFMSYNASSSPSGVFLLLSIWAVASAEIITLIAFYVYMKAKGFDFDVSKLSRLKW